MKKKLQFIPFFLLSWEFLASPKYIGHKYLSGSYDFVTRYINYLPYGRVIVLVIMCLVIPLASFFCSLELAYREKENKLLLALYIGMTVISIFMIPLSLMLFIMCLCLEK